MGARFLLVFAVVLAVISTDNGESVAPVIHCDKICALHLRFFRDLERNFLRLLRKTSTESIQVRETNTRKWKKIIYRVRRLHCIRKCLKTPRTLKKVYSYEIGRPRRETTDYRKNQCPKVGPSSAVVQNTTVVLTRTSPQDENLMGEWSVVVRWNPLEDSLVNFTGYNVAWIDFDNMEENVLRPLICVIVPKNQTTLIITEQDDWVYPNTIQLVVTTYPFAAKNPPIREYKFVKVPTSSTKKLSVSQANTPETSTSITQAASPMHTPLFNLGAAQGNNLTPGHIGAICAGVIVGVVLVTGVLLRVRHMKRSESTQTLLDAEVFISYRRTNYEWVNENVLRLMDQHNITYLIDYKDFEPGKPWLENMVDCMERSHKILIIMSKEYMSRTNCQAELDQAVYLTRGDRRLIVLRINDVNKDTLPSSIRNRTFIDYADEIERKTWKRRLVNILKASRSENKLLLSQVSNTWLRSETSLKTVA